jgi:hypothetical protein
MPIELAGIQLPRVHRIATVERADFASHRVPGLNGNLVQDLGRESVAVRIEGIFYGADATDKLNQLRDTYKNRKPADFLADITGQSYFSQVVIEQLDVWQRAGEPDQFSYALLVREYVPPPQPATAFAEGLSDLDAGLLDEALGFMDALALPDFLSAPGISDPTPPLASALEELGSTLSPLSGAAGDLGTAAAPATDQINGLAAEGNSGIGAMRDGQLGALGDSGAALQGVQPGVENSVQDVTAALGSQPMPAPPDAAGVQQGMADIADLLPTDLSALSAPITQEFDNFFGNLNTDLTQPLSGAAQRFGAVRGIVGIRDIFAENPAEQPAESAPRQAAAQRSSRDPNEPTALETALAELRQQLDTIPNPLNAETLLDWLHEGLSRVPRERLPLRQLPIFDELRDKLQTLHNWKAMTPAAFREHFAQQMNALADDARALFVAEGTQPVAERARTLASALAAESLAASFAAIQTGLADMAEKVNANGLNDAGTDIETLVGHVAQLRGDLADAAELTGEGGHAWLRSLNRLPLRLEGQMLHLFTGLRPTSDLDLLRRAFEPLNEALDGGGLAAVQSEFEGFFQKIRGLLSQLDLSVVAEALDTVIGGAANGLNQLRNALLSVTVEVAVILDRVEQAVQAVPTEALAGGLRTGLTAFRDAVQSGVTAAFDPARQLLIGAFDAIEGFLQNFNPAALLAELERILGALRNLLESNEVQGGIRQFKGALDEANAKISDFSFKSVADVVVDGIHAVETAIGILKNIPLTDGIKDEVRPAIQLLPNSLEGPVNTLQTELGELLDGEIIPALNEVKAKLSELLEAARGFTPEAYFSTYLVAPYESFLQELDAHRPSALLAGLQAELDRMKDEVRAAVNLEDLILTLDAPFQAMFGRLDAIDPAGFVEELEREFQAGIRRITDALPLDAIGEAFGSIADVIAEIRRAVRQLTAIRTFLTDLHTQFGGLSEARAQFEAIGDGFAARLDDLTDLPNAAAAAARIGESLQHARAAALLEAVQPAVGSLVARLRQPDAKAKLVGLVAAHRSFPRAQLDGLPDSAEKTALTALLDDFDPIHRDFSTPAAALEDFAHEIEAALTELPGGFTGWDARWFAPGSPLTQLGALDTTAAFWQNALRNTVRDEFAAQLAPSLGWVEHLVKFADIATVQLAALLQDVETQINALLNAGDRLQDLHSAFEQLIETLENFDLTIIGTELNQVFAAVRAKLDALRPATFLAPVQQAFDELLNLLDLNQLLGAAELDERFQRIHDMLSAANPANVLPDFEQLMNTIRARLAELDLSAQIDGLAQSLNTLKADLDEHLDRTAEAYDSMYAAIPSDLK